MLLLCSLSIFIAAKPSVQSDDTTGAVGAYDPGAYQRQDRLKIRPERKLRHELGLLSPATIMALHLFSPARSPWSEILAMSSRG